jgi:hypothetical protein
MFVAHSISTLKMEETRSSEMSGVTIPTLHHIVEHDVLHSYRFENFKSYIELTDWAL